VSYPVFALRSILLNHLSFALRFAVAAGATVIATSSSDDKLKLAASLGAKHLINYKKTPDWDEEVKKVVSNYQLLPYSGFTDQNRREELALIM
jgi:NADPH:quinone reductase-like Zn-dependent oxidoreductase